MRQRHTMQTHINGFYRPECELKYVGLNNNKVFMKGFYLT